MIGTAVAAPWSSRFHGPGMEEGPAAVAAALGIAPEVVEFWQGRENRVHNRIRVVDGRVERLQP